MPQSAQQLHGRHSVSLAHGGIDLNPILRIVGIERRLRPRYLRPLRKFGYEILSNVFQLLDGFVGIILYVYLKAVSHAVTGNDRLCERHYSCIFYIGEAAIYFRNDRFVVVMLPFSLFPRFQANYECAV